MGYQPGYEPPPISTSDYVFFTLVCIFIGIIGMIITAEIYAEIVGGF